MSAPAALDEPTGLPSARPSLLRDRDFASYLIGQAVSVTGSDVTTVAIPVLAAVQLHASTLQVSGLVVAGRLPPLLFTLPAGVWADRVAKKPLIVVTDVASGLVMLTLPAVSLAGTPPLAQLYAVTFLVAALQAVGSTASIAYVPALVGRERLVEAHARLGASNSLADLIGTNCGGVLVAILGGARAVCLDAVSYLVSAVMLLRIRVPEPLAPPRSERSSMAADIRAGLAYVWRTPLVRAFVVSNAATAAAMSAGAAIWSLFLLRDLHLSAQVLGVVMGAGGSGGVAGGWAGRRLAARFGPGPVILASLLLVPVAQTPLLFAPPGPVGAAVIGGGMAVQCACAVASGGLIRSVRQMLATDELQGRAQAAGAWLASALRPLAALAAGVLGTVVGLRATFAAITLALLVPFAVLWRSPVRQLTASPTPLELPAAAGPALPAACAAAPFRARQAGDDAGPPPPVRKHTTTGGTALPRAQAAHQLDDQERL